MVIVDMSDLNREEYTKKEWKKIYNKRYQQTEEGKEAHKRYEQSERYKEAKKHYQQSERGRTLHRARSTKRRAQKLNATVAWADENKILDIYLRAQRKTKQTGKQHAVDHFLPLQNINVCGLHCESNLRVILAKINNVKNNSFTPEIEKRVIQLMTRDQLKLKQ